MKKIAIVVTALLIGTATLTAQEKKMVKKMTTEAKVDAVDAKKQKLEKNVKVGVDESKKVGAKLKSDVAKKEKQVKKKVTKGEKKVMKKVDNQ